MWDFVWDWEMSGGSPICVRVMEEASDAFMVFTALFPYSTIYTVWAEEEEFIPNYIQIRWKSLGALGKLPYVYIYISFADII